MIPAQGDDLKAVQHVSQHVPRFRAFLEKVRKHELEALPYAHENLGIGQGRCQMATELCRLLEDSLKVAAQR